MSDLKKILIEIQTQSQTGNRRELTKALRALMHNRREYYRQSIKETLQEEFADALYKTLILELDEEENDSIETAELAYLALGAILHQNRPANPEHYKRRLLLLHYFSDFFTDAIIEVFLSAYRKDNILQARTLALECLEKMQLSDMLYLEENEAGFIDGDEQISDACNAIETNPDLFAQLNETSTFALAKQNNGVIAQSVEQRTENPCVPGSIPGDTTLKSDYFK